MKQNLNICFLLLVCVFFGILICLFSGRQHLKHLNMLLSAADAVLEEKKPELLADSDCSTDAQLAGSPQKAGGLGVEVKSFLFFRGFPVLVAFFGGPPPPVWALKATCPGGVPRKPAKR